MAIKCWQFQSPNTMTHVLRLILLTHMIYWYYHLFQGCPGSDITGCIFVVCNFTSLNQKIEVTITGHLNERFFNVRKIERMISNNIQTLLLKMKELE